MITKHPQLLLASVFALLIAGCATTLQVIDTNVPPIVLEKSQQGHFYITDVVTFPAGTYTADFKTKDGVFYRAPSKMVHSVMGGSMKAAKRGGIFIPLPEDKDQRLGVWFDHQEGSGGLIGYGLSSPTKVWRLRGSIEYEIQKETGK
jgi:hypothetical protein